MRFLLFFVGVFGGILLIIYHKKVAQVVGFRIGWAEKFLGPGGTYTAYILFGIIAIILGYLIGFGWISFWG